MVALGGVAVSYERGAPVRRPRNGAYPGKERGERVLLMYRALSALSDARYLGSHPPHPGVGLRANIRSISHRCHPILVAFVWELTKETIDGS